MTNGTSIEVLGGPQAAADIRRWADQLPAAVAKGTESFGQRVADSIRGRVPVLTGTLAGSVTSEAADDGIEVSMGDGVPYAGWIEFGGSRGREYVPEGRYVYPTAEEFEDAYVQAAEQATDESVRRFPWSTPPR